MQVQLSNKQLEQKQKKKKSAAGARDFSQSLLEPPCLGLHSEVAGKAAGFTQLPLVWQEPRQLAEVAPEA